MQAVHAAETAAKQRAFLPFQQEQNSCNRHRRYAWRDSILNLGACRPSFSRSQARALEIAITEDTMSLPAAVGLWTDCAAFDLPEELEVLVAQALSAQRKARLSYEALQVAEAMVTGSSTALEIRDPARSIQDAPDADELSLAKLPIQAALLSVVDAGLARSLASAADESDRQLTLDIERDRIRVNGVLMNGSDGIQTVFSRMKQLTRGFLDDCGLASPDDDQLQKIFKTVLRRLNRTESAALTYTALSRMCPPGCMLIPQSHLADPLELTISLGGFYSDGSSRTPHFGLCFEARARTIYRVVDQMQDDIDEDGSGHGGGGDTGDGISQKIAEFVAGTYSSFLGFAWVGEGGFNTVADAGADSLSGRLELVEYKPL